MACHCMEGSKIIKTIYIMNTACSTIFKDKSTTADKAEICWLSDKDGEVGSLICIIAARTKILRALGRVLVSVVINPNKLSYVAPSIGKCYLLRKAMPNTHYCLKPARFLAKQT